MINIRGMSEQFVGTLLNGREQVSTGDSRGVEFDQYPAELINAVTVYKTPDAALVGQGLSGTVDLQTIRPLSLGERRIVFGGIGERNSLGDLSDDGDRNGYRASASYVDQFADDTIGVALGVARLGFAVPGRALQGMVVGEPRCGRLGRPAAGRTARATRSRCRVPKAG